MIEIVDRKKKTNINSEADYLENIKLMVFDMDGVLLKNRNSWDVIINRSMHKATTGTGMQLTFDYIYQNGVPDRLYENLTETKIMTYLNLNDVTSNITRTIGYCLCRGYAIPGLYILYINILLCRVHIFNETMVFNIDLISNKIVYAKQFGKVPGVIFLNGFINEKKVKIDIKEITSRFLSIMPSIKNMAIIGIRK